MDLKAIQDRLRRERDHLTETIGALKRMAAGARYKRGGRPHLWLATSHNTMQPARRRGRQRKSRGYGE
jgi:hypothetical protein